MAQLPDFHIEQQYEGLVCGIDEAGRGPLAGPVVAACVAFPDYKILAGINDSKKLSVQVRQTLYDRIIAASHYGIGIASVAEIDALNILGATKLAMQRAYAAMPVICSTALIDGNQPPILACNTQAVIKGDAKSLSIAAASILAKVTRDHMMYELAKEYPQYGFERHAGYGTKAHMHALQKYGACIHHRTSFAPVHAVLTAKGIAA